MKELRKYQSFNSVAEMDNSISEYLSVYKLKESEYTVLWKIASYSCKFVGVSYLKVQTLADLVHYSKRTVQRSLKRLTELGIITRVESFKPVRGGHSAFINVINPFDSHTVLSLQEEAVEPTPECVDELPAHTDTIPSKTKISKDNTYVGGAEKDSVILSDGNIDTLQSNNELGVDHLVASGVPSEFAISVIPYFDATQVYKLWSKVQLAARKHAPDLVDTVEIAVSSVKASVLASKVKRVRDFTGYFYGVLAQKLSTAQRSLKCKLFNFLQ
ncbi:putative transcriptional regulator [Bacillus sp. LEw-kw-24]|uniref:helix-turn-helix domain-containing protein n=1 Tax=unclassified Bacillus (in: firmicutes) TaxID=185979 RepID=UPI0024063675|nr:MULTISPECIES: helix-turn-helix domain-containing protein [unclassified Bacillus (in: firmicutes)]MDF9887662.1 putative transcriptional regulator [Bacillus sp. LEw-kw-24]MDH6557960.1 putative transcriptional regulator [Bacillus sp. LEw-kw-2]